jgi:hypothetical protein
MLFYLGAVAWPDRAEYIYAEFVTDLRAVVATVNVRHGGCLRTRLAMPVNTSGQAKWFMMVSR